MEQSDNMNTFKKFIPLILGVVLVGAGIFTYFRGNELAKVCTEKTTATVVSMREEFDTSSNTEGMRYIYYPIVEYQVNGNSIRKELGSGSNPPAYSVNDTVEILYNPNKAEEFIVAGENQNIVWIILTGIGAVFTCVGIFLLFKK